MNKRILNKVLIFILGGIFFSSITVYAATTILSKDIKFTPENTNWEVENVEEAINSLYADKNSATLLWTNSDLSLFSPQTIELDLSQYDYIIIDGYYSVEAEGTLSKSIIKKGTSQYVDIGSTYNSSVNRAVAQIRLVTVNDGGVTFGEQLDYSSNGENAWGIPYHIWGLKLSEIK